MTCLCNWKTHIIKAIRIFLIYHLVTPSVTLLLDRRQDFCTTSGDRSKKTQKCHLYYSKSCLIEPKLWLQLTGVTHTMNMKLQKDMLINKKNRGWLCFGLLGTKICKIEFNVHNYETNRVCLYHSYTFSIHHSIL